MVIEAAEVTVPFPNAIGVVLEDAAAPEPDTTAGLEGAAELEVTEELDPWKKIAPVVGGAAVTVG